VPVSPLERLEYLDWSDSPTQAHHFQPLRRFCQFLFTGRPEASDEFVYPPSLGHIARPEGLLVSRWSWVIAASHRPIVRAVASSSAVFLVARVLGNGIPFGLDALEGLLVENRGWKSFRILLDLPNHVSVRCGLANRGMGSGFCTLSDSIRQLPAPPPAGCPGTAPLRSNPINWENSSCSFEPMHSLAVLALASLVPVRSTVKYQSETGKGKDLTFAYFDHHLSLLKVAQVLFPKEILLKISGSNSFPHLRPLLIFLAKVLLK